MKSPTGARVNIRPANPKDRDAIVSIQYNALKFLSAKDYNPQQLKALLRSKSTPRKSPEIIFVAEIEGKTVGFASLLYPPNTIGAVFVDPNFARRKIGTQLLARLEQEAIANKIPILWVCASLTGYSFYKANNYQTIRKMLLPLYSTYIPCVQMKKRLLPITIDEILEEIAKLLGVTVMASVLILFLSLFS